MHVSLAPADHNSGEAELSCAHAPARTMPPSSAEPCCPPHPAQDEGSSHGGSPSPLRGPPSERGSSRVSHSLELSFSYMAGGSSTSYTWQALISLLGRQQPGEAATRC